MSGARPVDPIDRDRFDAVLFDLDGVLTATAKIHAACWKQMFDAYLQQRAAERGEQFQPFEIATDYKIYVDGKPRYDGVRDFLRSRDIELPEGETDDPPGNETIRGLGNRKNEMVNAAIDLGQVEAYDGSVELVKRLRADGIKTAVVSSSNNCLAILEAAGMADLFDTRVDGGVAEELNLPGKPAPDTFLAAAKNLAVEPPRAVVVEDAISGVQAGKAGGFGLVVGVARKGEHEELKANGADLVVADLSEFLS